MAFEDPARDDPPVGRPAPEWKVEHWINSEPLELSELVGKVVLVRWWTGPGCPHCEATAPSLNHFHRDYAKKGLVVIGLYHHKSSEPFSPDSVRALAHRFGLEFPIAVDPGWRTLRAWWLDGGERDFTSVSFLLDRRGVIRYVHPGGQYVRGDAAYEELETRIERLLSEPAP